MRHHLLACAAFAALLPVASFAQPLIQSQEGIALQNEILQLRQQVQQLQGNAGGSGSSMLGGSYAPPPAASSSAASKGAQGDLVAKLLTQVQQLQSQVQDLSGKLSVLQNQVNTQHDQTEKEIGDLKFQISNGASGAPASAPSMPPPPPAPSAKSAPAAHPAATLKSAEDAYAKHDYASAAAQARAVVAQDKKGDEATHAQYLLAQALAAGGKPQDAAIAYDDAYNRDRAGPYAPHALLGLARSLADIHQNEAACDTLSSLNSQFPTPPKGLQPRIDAVSKQAHCR